MKILVYLTVSCFGNIYFCGRKPRKLLSLKRLRLSKAWMPWIILMKSWADLFHQTQWSDLVERKQMLAEPQHDSHLHGRLQKENSKILIVHCARVSLYWVSFYYLFYIKDVVVAVEEFLWSDEIRILVRFGIWKKTLASKAKEISEGND